MTWYAESKRLILHLIPAGNARFNVFFMFSHDLLIFLLEL